MSWLVLVLLLLLSCRCFCGWCCSHGCCYCDSCFCGCFWSFKPLNLELVWNNSALSHFLTTSRGLFARLTRAHFLLNKDRGYLVVTNCSIVNYPIRGLSIHKIHNFCLSKTTWDGRTDGRTRPMIEMHFLGSVYFVFLDATTHLYKRSCQSVRPSVRPYIPRYF